MPIVLLLLPLLQFFGISDPAPAPPIPVPGYEAPAAVPAANQANHGPSSVGGR